MSQDDDRITCERLTSYFAKLRRMKSQSMNSRRQRDLETSKSHARTSRMYLECSRPWNVSRMSTICTVSSSVLRPPRPIFSGRSGVICKGEMTFTWEGRFETSLGPKRCNLRSGHASNAMLQCTALLKQSRARRPISCPPTMRDLTPHVAHIGLTKRDIMYGIYRGTLLC